MRTLSGRLIVTPSQRSAVQHSNAVPISAKVLEAIAQAEETDPLDIHRRLYEVVDSDALETLIRTTDSALTVEFTYNGYNVTVQQDGEVYINKLSN